MNSDLHAWVHSYNWDDGLAPIWDIANSTQTEFATALMIYWLLGGPWLELSDSDTSREPKRLQLLVRERLLAGYYPRGSCQFAPELTRVQLYQLRKAGVHELLLAPSNTC